MLEQWRKQLQERSGSLTTNEVMPQRLAEKLLEEDEALKEQLVFEELHCAPLSNGLDAIPGLNILAGLQRSNKPDHFTVFRSLRFPTYKRMYDMVYSLGYAFSNYEQERILDLYLSNDYVQQREKIRSDYRFRGQLQERVVHGLPVFCLANDALQIHRSFRGDRDQVGLVALHIPKQLILSKKVTFIANTDIDTEYYDDTRDYFIEDYVEKENTFRVDYSALRARGIDLHEMYSKNLPLTLESAKALGIQQDFYLLEMSKIIDAEPLRGIWQDAQLLKDNQDFMHGFFGDHCAAGICRDPTQYVPVKCFKLKTV
jgi:hypothetical protein